MRYYAFFDPFNNSSLIRIFPLSIKTGPDEDLVLPKGCKEIEQIEFNAYKTLGVVEEEPFSEIELNTDDVVERVMIYYYYHYSKLLHSLMHNHDKSNFFWLKPEKWSEEDIDISRVRVDMSKPDTNPFFRNTINEVDKLGMDILKNGMYFPFTFQHNYMNGQPQLVFGRHRLYSLLNVPKSIIQDSTFLFTYIPKLMFTTPYPPQENSLMRIDYKMPVECYCLSKNLKHIYKSKCNNNFYMWNYLVSFCDTLSAALHPYRLHIPPNPIYNNEDKFKKFIESSFPICSQYE